MEAAIKQLGDVLQRRDPSVIGEATLICKNMTGDHDVCNQLRPVLKDILRVTDPEYPSANDAIVALVNITSNAPDAITDLIAMNAVSRFLDRAIAPEEKNVHDTLMLLTNLTRDEEGCRKLLDVDDGDVCGHRLLRLAVRFAQPQESDSIPTAVEHHGLNVIAPSTDVFEYAAQVLMNATMIPEGREVFYATPDFFMPRLLDAISDDNIVRKQGIIGVIRNLCFEHSRHEYLLQKAGILPFIMKPLIAKTIEANEEACKLLKIAFPGMRLGENQELVPANRRNLLDTLLLLSQSPAGKSALVQHNVVFVMRELDEYETDEENKEIGMRISGILMANEDE